MTLAFTICSVNYLAQARTLGDSLRQTNPDWQFVIGLVDDLATANLPADLLPDYPMLEVAALGIPDFAGMCTRYDITELNTAVKPFFIDYFFNVPPGSSRAVGKPTSSIPARLEPGVTSVIYFDPDIIVFQPLTRLKNALETHSLVLTPHTIAPTPDWETPNEQHHLNTGIFNLGFIGLRNDDTARQFVSWWQKRLTYECRIDLCAGLFVDQHWVNFAPIYHDNVLIEKHIGYNVAYWNIHERHLAERAGTWMVQPPDGGEAVPLQFFHYSGYGVQQPDSISKYQTRYTFSQRPDLVPLFRYYHDRLIQNGNDAYRAYPCVYIKPPPVLYYTSVRRLLNVPIRRLTNWIG